MSETLFPARGRVSCTTCFSSVPGWGTASIEADGWVLQHNPLAWGSRNPRILLLGFSKGPMQNERICGPHDDIPFAGFRVALNDILRSLGLLGPLENISSRIRADEPDWAFGSLIRCSVGRRDPETGALSMTSDVVAKAASRQGERDWMAACADRFLARLPDRLRLVLLLSNHAPYVNGCYQRLQRLHPDLRRLNPIAYTNGNVTWVHVVHASGLAAAHRKAWLNGRDTTQGRKYQMALEAVRVALGGVVSAPVPSATPPVADYEETRASKPRQGSSVRRPRGTGEPLPANPRREVVAAALRKDGRLRPHPDRPTETKYVRNLVAPNGRAIAHDKTGAGSQHLWVRAEGVPISAFGRLETEHYDTKEGRNSNLAPQLQDIPVFRIAVETAEDVRAVSAVITLLPPLR